MRRYLISGPPGSGKTSVGLELKRRGFRVIDTDAEWAYLGDRKTKQPHDLPLSPNASPEWFERNAWLWNRQAVESSLLHCREHVIFCCGGADNDAEFFGLFDEVFMLNVDWNTLKKRMTGRTNHHMGTETGLQYLYKKFYVERDISMYDLIHINSSGHPVEVTASSIMLHVDERTEEKLKRSIKAAIYRLSGWVRSIFPRS
jgi:gluconate kinase